MELWPNLGFLSVSFVAADCTQDELLYRIFSNSFPFRLLVLLPTSHFCSILRYHPPNRTFSPPALASASFVQRRNIMAKRHIRKEKKRK